MANQQATLTNIPLKASLNLNKIECDIKPYTGFHDDNALFIGGVKNNMYKKTFWDGQTNGEKVFICHKDDKNYFAVNKGVNNIAVVKETNVDNGETKSELIALIDNNRKFARTLEGKYNDSQEISLYNNLTGNTYLVNWVLQSGRLSLTVKINDDTISQWSLLSSNKSIQVSCIGKLGLLITAYDVYSAKKISDVQNIIYRFEDGGFYKINNTSNDLKGFIWAAEQKTVSDQNYFLYIQSSGTTGGIQKMSTSELIEALQFTSVASNYVFTVNANSLSNKTSLSKTASVSAIAEAIVRPNGKGIEVGIRRSISAQSSSGITEDAYVYMDRSGNLITDSMYTDADDAFAFLSIAGDVNYGLWSGGLAEHINDNFDITFYGGIPFCITSRNNRVKIEQNIDEILWNECTDTDVYYTFEGNKYKLTIEDQDAGQVSYQVINDYIFFNVDSEYNTVRLSDGKVFNRCNDYISLAIPYLENDQADGSYYVSDKTYAEYATGYRVMYSRDNYSDIGMILAPLIVKKAFLSEAYSYYLPDGGYDDIQVFWGKTSESDSSVSAPVYFTTLRNGYDSKYESVYYPVLTSNIIYNPSVLDRIEDTFFDEYLFNDGQYSYVSTRSQNQSIVLGYYVQTLAEFDKVFIIQGTHYAVQGNYIIQLNINSGVISGVAPMAYIGDLQYVGSTVTEALFWSPIDRSFYTFKGDRTLTKFIESNRIKEVVSVFSQPSISCIAVSTVDDELDENGNNKGSVLFFYGDQMIRLEIKTSNRIYYTNNSFVIDNTEYCFLKRDGYTKEPINIETEFYLTQPFIEETNDCVYITLFDESPTKGKVELSCMTLKEGQFKSEKKIFDINPSMFDKNQKYLRLRYQPQYQTGAFSFKIKSDFPIAGLAISHRRNNVANSTYND